LFFDRDEELERELDDEDDERLYREEEYDDELFFGFYCVGDLFRAEIGCYWLDFLISAKTCAYSDFLAFMYLTLIKQITS
jgi:hypothetical protein